MTAIDPHLVLGLPPGASQAEIKRAYRQLAKQYHPDSAGDRAVARFLAIQAAYEALVDEPARPRTGRTRGSSTPGPPAPPWQADAARARATRDAYRARTRRATGGAPRDAPGAASGGSGGSTGSAAGATGGPAGGRSTRGRKATIGSTSYDGVEAEPFTPPWEGATWYGAGSGTYWTLNPKEYADPRKHGPEYLARSRRASESTRAAEPAGRGRDEADPVGAAAGPVDGAAAGGPSPGAGSAATHGTARPGGWSTSARQALADDPPRRPPTGDGLAPRVGSATTPASRSAATARPTSTTSGRSPSGPARFATTPVGRLGLAILGWLPLGVALAALSDVVPACDGIGVCSDPLRAGIWPVHLAIIALLVAVPRLAAIAAVGGVAFLGVGLAATPVLLAVGGAQTREGTVAALAFLLVAAWVGGIALALSGRMDLPPWRGRRVR